jgi:prepilin-type N-terminal cleavage/methylation domain-containing protein/prepilin-type processing-associated H-X9-DG protein
MTYSPIRASHVRSARTAFTLVELLVVIGIIALLISLLLPALNNARKQASQTKCLAQMRSVGQAMMNYVIDNKGSPPYTRSTIGPGGVELQRHGDIPGWEIPAWTGGLAGGTRDFANPRVYQDWMNGRNAVQGWPNFLSSLLPYMGVKNEAIGVAVRERADFKAKLFTCQDAREWPFPRTHVYSATDFSQTNYLFNGVMVNRKYSQIKRPSAIIILQESRYVLGTLALRPRAVPQSGGSTTDPFSGASAANMTYTEWCFTDSAVQVNRGFLYSDYAEVHGKLKSIGGNFLFADGHAEFKPVLSLRARDFGLGNQQTGAVNMAGVTGDPDDSVLTSNAPGRFYTASGLK